MWLAWHAHGELSSRNGYTIETVGVVRPGALPYDFYEICLFWNVHDDFFSWFVVVVAFTRIFHFSNRGCASTSQCDVVETFGPKIFIDCGGNGSD